jgi:hypothetical protein
MEYGRYEKLYPDSTIQAPDLESTTGDESLGKTEGTPLDTPVRVSCHTRGRRLGDCDGRSIKAALDALVIGGILPSDSYESVKEVRYTQEFASEDQTILTIEVMETED